MAASSIETEWIRATEAEHAPWILTGFDRATLHMVLRGTWIFKAQLDVVRLKESLASILSLYPHLAGRLVEGKEVRCNNAGVPFSVTSRPDIRVSDIQTNHNLANAFADRPKTGKAKKGKEPGLKVRVTHLLDGSVLSVCCMHALMDGNGFYSMVSNWARCQTGRSFPKPLLKQSLMPKPASGPKYDAIRRAREAGWHRYSLLKLFRLLLSPSLFSGKPCRRAPAVFFPLRLCEELKQSAMAASEGTALTFNDVLCAHLSKMCARLIGHADGVVCRQGIVVDTRQRIPELPPNFVGNGSSCFSGAAFRVGEPLEKIAENTHNSLAPYLKKPSPLLAKETLLALELIAHRALYLPYDFTASLGPSPTTFFINSFLRLPVYDVDFGVEGSPIRPVLVIPHDSPDQILIWPAPPEANGIEIYFGGPLGNALEKQDKEGAWWKEMLNRQSG